MSPHEFKPEYIGTVTESGVGLFMGISDLEIGWDGNEWRENEEKELYDQYYLPSVMGGSKGRGIALVGYGGYMGYIDVSEDGKDSDLLVGVGGHTLHRGPLVNVPVDEKNANFRHICDLIESGTDR